MKFQRQLQMNFDDLLILIDREEDKRQESLNDYFWRLRAEERKLRRKKLKMRRIKQPQEIEEKLNVIEGYDLLGAHFNDS